MWAAVAAWLLAGVALACARLYMVLPDGARAAPRSRRQPAVTMLVLGSGGHTTELLSMSGALDRARYAPRHYVLAASDRGSASRALAFELGSELAGRLTASTSDAAALDACLIEASAGAARIWRVPRAREVGQAWLSSALTTLWAFVHSALVVLRVRPDVVLCNGPGTCVPIVVAAYMLRFCGWRHVRVVFVESFCRVQTLSLSGRLLYRLADRFIVQWPQLLRRYPRAEYVGLLS